MLPMKIYCGTKQPFEETIDLDEFGVRNASSAFDTSSEDKLKAYDILQELLNDTSFADDHFRNTCAVNGCIALHVLGFVDAGLWFRRFCNKQKGQNHGRFFDSDLDKFMDHVDRVNPYLEKWGPEGSRELALGYTID